MNATKTKSAKCEGGRLLTTQQPKEEYCIKHFAIIFV